MSLNMKAVWIKVVFVLLMMGMVGLCLVPRASAADRNNIKKAQKALRDKGYNPGSIDGVMGSQTRMAISQYQKSENLPVTGRLDTQTAGSLGVGHESAGGDSKSGSVGSDSKSAPVGSGSKSAPVGGGSKSGSVGGDFKNAGKDVGRGGEGFGHEIKEGKPIAAGKELGKGVGEGGKKIGEGGKKIGEEVKKLVTQPVR